MATNFEDLLEQLLADKQAQGGQLDSQTLLTASLLEGLSAGRRQEQLVTAPRTDAYGNTVRYDPVRGWIVDKTPTTQAIVDADQTEQLNALREDAPRNRAASQRMSARSELADDAFTREFNNYQYRPRKTEQDYISEAQRGLIDDRQTGLDKAGELMSRQALRGGNGTAADFASAFSKVREGAFDGVSNQGRRQGMQDFLSFEGGKQGVGQRDLEFLSGLAGQDGRVPVQPSSITGSLNNSTTQALHALIQALSGNEQSRSAQAAQLAALLEKTGA